MCVSNSWRHFIVVVSGTAARRYAEAASQGYNRATVPFRVFLACTLLPVT